jgi:K+-transporting ATPase KdpF subunit
VNLIELVTVIVTLFGFVYLVWALLRAEDF